MTDVLFCSQEGAQWAGHLSTQCQEKVCTSFVVFCCTNFLPTI